MIGRLTRVVWILGVSLITGSSLHAGLLEDMGIDSEASRMVREQNYAPKKTKAPPAQHSGAEGLPPLPLPVVPQRRTEKKNPPRPPVLVAKLATKDYIDWATSPEDVKNLMKWMAREMDVDFSTINLPLDRIPANAAQIPVLYRTGIRAFEFTDKQRQKLRSYLLSGGTLIMNAYCGHPDFARSALKEIQQLIPEHPPYRLEPDHPLYRAYYEMKDIRYRPLAVQAGARNGVPSAIGIDINTRTAVFFFRYDLSTAWDKIPSDKMHIVGYEYDTAKQLGANLAAYITAQRSTAMPLSRAMQFVDTEEGRAGKLAVAQVQYSGLWKTRDTSLPMLLNIFHRQTNTPVRFEKRDLRLDSARIFDHPLLYMTGTISFSLTDRERRNLREYLRRGGVLLAEATGGRQSFDRSFRKEIAAILPGVQLQKLPPNHPIFQYPNVIEDVMPRPALARRLEIEGKIQPLLLGVNVAGRLAVIYSPYDLSGGWALDPGPYNQGLEDRDALSLGVNILTNALMQ